MRTRRGERRGRRMGRRRGEEEEEDGKENRHHRLEASQQRKSQQRLPVLMYFLCYANFWKVQSGG